MTQDTFGPRHHQSLGDPDFEPPFSTARPPFAQQVPQVPQGNPLAAYFRVPGIHIPIPTGGAYLPPGAYHPDIKGELPIYPMRATDEFLLKNPDALMSGLAVERLLESCVPGIKTPGLISSPDLDVLLLAIKVASSGEMMDVSVRCPKCSHDNEFECHLPSLLKTVKPVPRELPVRLSDDLVAYVRPYNYHNATQMALLTFQETRRLQGLPDDISEEDRLREMQSSIDKIANMESTITADCVYRIVTPVADVTNPLYIAEFMSQARSQYTRAISTALESANDSGMDKTMAVRCQNEECGHEWSTAVEFDPASFFE